MPLGYWILDENGTPQKATLMEWGAWLELPDRIQKWSLKTEISPDVVVSTVFLSLDHNFWPEGPPILFETMIFGGLEDGYQDRYATWKDAIDGHARAVALADQSKADVARTIDDLVVGSSESE